MCWTVLFLSLLVVSTLGQIPSRAYDNYTVLGRTVTPQSLDECFVVSNVAFWSTDTAQVKGRASIVAIDLADHRPVNNQFSVFSLELTQKLIKGFNIPRTNQSIMILNDLANGLIGKFSHSTGSRVETIIEPDCTEDLATGINTCTGLNRTITRTTLVSTITPIGTLNKADGLEPILTGQVDWTRNRGYFPSVGNNFTIYVWDIQNMRLISRTLTITAPGSLTGSSDRTQLSDDGTILYILTSTNRFYAVRGISTSAPTIDLIFDFAGNKYNPTGFIVSDSMNEVMFTAEGGPAPILWFDLDQRRIGSVELLPQLVSPQVIHKDGPAGFAFVVGFATPSLVVRFNLATHESDEPFSLNDAGRSSGGFIHLESSSIFIGAQQDSIRFRYPGACPLFCSEHGTCSAAGLCDCAPGWSGEGCDFVRCPSGQAGVDCSGNGRCSRNGTCECFPGYGGISCDNFTCPGGCSGQGQCDLNTHTCRCNVGYELSDCSQSIIGQCELSRSCGECAKFTQCLWCESSETCLLGDINGPLTEYCPLWHYRSCNYFAFRFVGYFFVAVCFLFLLFNIIATIMEDKRGESVYLEKSNVIRSLWVCQRDLQTWFMVEQVQIGALLALLAVPLPSNFKHFTDALQIMLLITKPPWQPDHLPVIAARNPQSVIQTGITEGTHPVDLMAGAFFVFLIMTAFCLVYTIIAFAVQNNMAKWRGTHIFIRCCQFAQPGLVALGAYTITQLGQEYTDSLSSSFAFAGAFLSILFLGLLFPLFAIVYVKLNKKNLFAVNNRVQFGSLYDTYHHDKFWFGGVHLFKVSCISLFIGFFADTTSGWHSPIMSMLMPIFIIIIYIITVCVARPYVDKLRGIVQTVMFGIFDIIIFGLCIVYLRLESFDGWSIAVAALIGGNIFFCGLMWFMNALRVGAVNPHSAVDDNQYIRM